MTLRHACPKKKKGGVGSISTQNWPPRQVHFFSSYCMVTRTFYSYVHFHDWLVHHAMQPSEKSHTIWRKSWSTKDVRTPKEEN